MTKMEQNIYHSSHFSLFLIFNSFKDIYKNMIRGHAFNLKFYTEIMQHSLYVSYDIFVC